MDVQRDLLGDKGHEPVASQMANFLQQQLLLIGGETSGELGLSVSQQAGSALQLIRIKLVLPLRRRGGRLGCQVGHGSSSVRRRRCPTS